MNFSTIFLVFDKFNNFKCNEYCQFKLQDPSSSIMEGILMFNKHLLFIVIMIVIAVGWLLFNTVSNYWQNIVELIYDIVSQLLSDLISVRSDKYFPFISILFTYILFHNLIGLIPYTFTTTSHLIITFSLSFSTFIGINILCFKKHNIRMFSLFLPANSTFFLSLVLVPIEFVSYIFKPVSLGVRLFINLMAGHSLLKIIVGFSWSMLLIENFQSFGFILPLIILLVLMGLELGVALIQTYVFVTLVCIYLNEGEILH